METTASKRNPGYDPAGDCQEAIALGIALLKNENLDPTQYKLIAAENLIKGPDYAGPHVWRLRFKLKELIPDTADEEVGAGGERFVLVDLAARATKMLGAGD